MGEVVIAPLIINRGPQPGLEREVFQHGSIGEFLTSSIEGVQSGFVRCVYKAKDAPSNTVTLLCEKKDAGCCIDGCCPKDQFWMTPLIVLLMFVLVIFVVGCLSMICCYQRSKNKQRKEEKIAFEQHASVADPSMYARPSPFLQDEFYPGSPYNQNTNNIQRPRY
uniref:CX domain-containing protein n=1 Tax=Ditylenchus dipsaci TaxID=166011 RepID=A0A915D2I8_9BILA